MKEELLSLINYIGEKGHDVVSLHEPCFFGNERKYVDECIDSTFVSSVGEFVERFEMLIAEFTGSKYAIATVNGTAALHVALKLSGVTSGNEVITQPLTFIATCNAINYCGALPIFIDIDRDTLGLSPYSLECFLSKRAVKRDDGVYNKYTGRKIAAVVPVHTFGHPCKIEQISNICQTYGVPLIEDAAESLGSFYKGRHTGTFGVMSAFSFNGNKIITTGGGGVIVTDDEELARRVKHITTTSKVPHSYEYVHDEVGYNYRLPNINAALGCAQMENLSIILKKKRLLARQYSEFCSKKGIDIIQQPKDCQSNYWLNAIVLDNKKVRNEFLSAGNELGVLCRPVWKLMNKQIMFQSCESDDLANARWIEERVVNIPSSVALS